MIEKKMSVSIDQQPSSERVTCHEIKNFNYPSMDFGESKQEWTQKFVSFETLWMNDKTEINKISDWVNDSKHRDRKWEVIHNLTMDETPTTTTEPYPPSLIWSLVIKRFESSDSSIWRHSLIQQWNRPNFAKVSSLDYKEYDGTKFF